MSDEKHNWLSRLLNRKENEHPEVTQPIETPGQEDPIQAAASPLYKSQEQIRAEEQHVPLEWKVGDVILDTYEVKEIHEGGGMGLVYRVHHRNWNMDLAVKNPRANFFQTQQQKDNFVRECETWIDLGLHPHIVSCHYVRNLGGIPRVFAEYVEGGTLKDWIDSRKLYEGGPDKALERILDIAIQMAWGLQYAHEKGLIHQDVKPANVLMTEDLSTDSMDSPQAGSGQAVTAKITDFGLAKARVAAGDKYVPGSGRSILVSTGGMTPAYCSPEQANHKPLTRRTDIWSWAVSILEMFTGEVTWSYGQAAGETLEVFLQTGAEESVIPRMPEELIKLLRQCFAGSIEHRPASFKEVAHQLLSIYEKMAGRRYAREEPEAFRLQAESLNNHAVSMCDIGQMEQGERLFKEALQTDPMHLESVFNSGLINWRRGKLTDRDFISTVEETIKRSHSPRHNLLVSAYVEACRPDMARKIISGSLMLENMETIISSSLPPEHTLDTAGNPCLAAEGRLCLLRNADSLKLWDIANSRNVYTVRFGLALGDINAIDSSWHASVDDGGRFIVWGSWSYKQAGIINVRENKQVTLEHNRSLDLDHVRIVAVTRNGFIGCAVGVDGVTCIWDTQTGKCRLARQFDRQCNVAALSEDGQELILGCTNGDVLLIDANNGRILRRFTTELGRTISAVGIQGEKGLVFAGNAYGRLFAWDMASGIEKMVVRGPNPVEHISASPDCTRVLAGRTLWTMPEGRCLCSDIGYDQGMLSNGLLHAVRQASPSSLEMVSNRSIVRPSPLQLCRTMTTNETAERNKRYRKLETRASQLAGEEKNEEAWQVLCEARRVEGYARSRQALDLASSIRSRGRIKGLADKWPVRTFSGHRAGISAVRFSNDDKFVISASLDGSIRLWNIDTGHVVAELRGHDGCVCALRITPDGRLLSGGDDGKVRLWDAAGRQCINTFEGHTKSVTALDVSADGKTALSCSKDGSLRIWELASGKCLACIPAYTGQPLSCEFSHDASRVVVCGGSCVEAYDLGVERRRRIKCSGRVYATSFSYDRDQVLLGGEKGILQILNLLTGATVFDARVGDNDVNCVSFLPDNRWIACGSNDASLYIWDRVSGRNVAAMSGHEKSISSLAVSRTGRWILSGSWDETVRLWELDWDTEFPRDVKWYPDADLLVQSFLCQSMSGMDGRDKLKNLKGSSLSWPEVEFGRLLDEFRSRGFGWIDQSAIRTRLEQMAFNRMAPAVFASDITEPVKSSSTDDVKTSTGDSGPLMCPKCKSAEYKAFRLGQKTVHKCASCGFKDY